MENELWFLNSFKTAILHKNFRASLGKFLIHHTTHIYMSVT